MNGNADDLRRLFAGDEPPELARYLITPNDEIARFAGSGAFVIGGRRGVTLPSGVVIAEGMQIARGPLDYMGVYVVLSEYISFAEADDPDAQAILVSHFARRYPPDQMLIQLAVLNWIARDKDDREAFEAEFLAQLTAEPRARLKARLDGSATGTKAQLLARQPILAAMTAVLTAQGPIVDEAIRPSAGLIAALLTHAVGDTLHSETSTSNEKIGEQEPQLFMEILRVGPLYASDDMAASIDRVLRLWNTYGGSLERYPTRRPPAELVVEATGLELEDLLAIGFAFYAHVNDWTPERPPLLSYDGIAPLDPDKLARFRAVTASSVDKLASAIAPAPSHFDFLAVQQRPVLELQHGLLVLDIDYLWERVTDGLYWIVHDHEKTISAKDQQRWRDAWGEMVEEASEDSIRTMAPPVLDGSTTFYTEEDIGRGYGGKRADAAIHFGAHLALFEVVSGQLTVKTRVEGDVASFKADTEKMVMKKVRQLHETAAAILNDEVPLTGHPNTLGVRIVPIVVASGGYPINPSTVAYVSELMAAEQLLQDPRVETLAIIDLGELETLEALAEHGKTPVEVIVAWKSSGIAQLPLRNYILATESWRGADLRPARMRASYRDAARDMVERLGYGAPPDNAE